MSNVVTQNVDAVDIPLGPVDDCSADFVEDVRSAGNADVRSEVSGSAERGRVPAAEATQEVYNCRSSTDQDARCTFRRFAAASSSVAKF